mmetsp:Transcript_20639/g.36640  ORF Transcript_20639/g.36640 Transcript_20639/m.36640 type:complete len:188 (+) Transcript_20639:1-564(+)
MASIARVQRLVRAASVLGRGSQRRRGISSASSSTETAGSSGESLPWHLWIPMPSFSPVMSEGKLLNWIVKEGERIGMTELIAEVEVDKLSDLIADGGATTMEMESHEEGYLARIFVKEGETRVPGAPIGLLCESKGDIEAFRNLKEIPSDVSDSMFVWQAYVASAADAQEHCRIPEHNQDGSGKTGC